MYEMAEDLNDSGPVAKEEQLNYLAHINGLRAVLKKRVPPFPFQDFLEVLKARDTEQKEYLPLEDLDEVCQEFRLNLDKKMLTDLMQAVGILTTDGQVKYTTFMELINWKQEFPHLTKICGPPQTELHYETSYLAAHPDRVEIDHSVRPAAGMPSSQHDSKYPGVAFRDVVQHFGD